MNECYLSLGSNQNCPPRQIRRAIVAIKALPSTYLIKTSRLHTTKAWGLTRQQNFCNAAVAIHTRLSPLNLLKYCQAIELKQQRVRKNRWGPRTLDIDIIFYGHIQMQAPQLVLPHPQWHLRNFVKIPLADLDITSAPSVTRRLSEPRP